MDNRRCVIRVNTDEQKRVKRQTAYRAIQSTPEFKYFKCSAWLRDQETSEFAQAIVIPDWEDISGTNKRAWEKSATMALEIAAAYESGKVIVGIPLQAAAR